MAEYMFGSRTVGVSIAKDWRDLYEAIWSPEIFPRWASGLSTSALRREGDVWRAEGPEGPVAIRFTEHNPFGVMDHRIEIGDGIEIYVPLRVVPNGSGAEVLLTLFRQADTTDEVFARDVAWVARDLDALKAMASADR